MSDSKFVLITGASTGIGRACALYLDHLGWHVFAAVRKSADAHALREQASNCLTPIYLDLTEPDKITDAKEQVADAVGSAGLSGLVNNAGIARAGPVEFLPLADYRATLEVNLLGAIAVTQALIPLLRLARGRIVNMSSVSGIIATPFMTPYNTSKFALEAFSDALRVELRPWGMHVSVVEPGDIATPIWDKSINDIEESMQRWPQGVNELYGPALDAMRRRAQRRTGIPPIHVARAVEHALIAPRPKIRYRVGRDAKLVRLFALLPERLRDWIIASRLPQYGSQRPL
jgi:NAD(P)-dependent dehydrogenase (short-subunit alcohol dehydrogenase family)